MVRAVFFCSTSALSFMGLFACSWQRFDDVTENAPVVQLKKPDKLGSGFGVTLATATLDDRVFLLSTGTPGRSPGAVYELGTGQDPVVDTVDSAHCDNQHTSCVLSRQPAGLGRARGPSEEKELCFALGLGSVTGNDGIVVRCSDKSEHVLQVPSGILEAGFEPFLEDQPVEPIVLGADREPLPFLLAALADERRAWFYPPERLVPIELSLPGTAPPSFGSTLAVLFETDETRLFAVGAPEEGQVWLFRADESSVQPIGCLGPLPGFGRVLAAGRVTAGDEVDDLVVSDDTNVTVFDGSALSVLEETESTDCSLGGLVEGAVITSFGCGSSGATRGCETAEFGAALAVGDLDADGDGEVLVGAPGMIARDKTDAGAVLVFDAEGSRPFQYTEIKFLSSADDGDRLGGSLAAANLGDRHLLVAGAPGNGKTVLFYCSGLTAEGERGKRCQ